MAQVGSAVNTSLKARIEAPNSNECNKATARSNRGATAASQEVGKWTVPSCSAEGCGWSCASVGALAAKKSVNSETIVALLIGLRQSICKCPKRVANCVDSGERRQRGTHTLHSAINLTCCHQTGCA